MAKRGRPIKSQIRQNIIELLFYMKKAYTNDVYKKYIAIFPKVTMRVIYYHMKKGVTLNEIKVAEIKKEKGNFSWGSEVEKTYYSLGPNSKPVGDLRVNEYFDKSA